MHNIIDCLCNVGFQKFTSIMVFEENVPPIPTISVYQGAGKRPAALFSPRRTAAPRPKAEEALRYIPEHRTALSSERSERWVLSLSSKIQDFAVSLPGPYINLCTPKKRGFQKGGSHDPIGMKLKTKVVLYEVSISLKFQVQRVRGKFLSGSQISGFSRN